MLHMAVDTSSSHSYWQTSLLCCSNNNVFPAAQTMPNISCAIRSVYILPHIGPYVSVRNDNVVTGKKINNFVAVKNNEMFFDTFTWL